MLGFVLGIRHATEPDHVVAVTTIVSRERSLSRAALVGIFWGIGHSTTILVIGSAIVFGHFAIPPRVSLSMELAVGIMLVVLGSISLRGSIRRRPRVDDLHDSASAPSRWPLLFRSLLIGVVHGLAGSAAIALLVLTTIREPLWGLMYLAVFGIGTMAGMLITTVAVSVPFTLTANRSGWVNRGLGTATALLSVGLGLVLVYGISLTDGLFTSWRP